MALTQRVAFIATDGVEEPELTEPLAALKNAGCKVEVLSIEPGEIQAFRHHDKSIRIKVDRTLDEAKPEEYDALVLPGGALNADAARVNKKVLAFVQGMENSKKPLAVICHAPWILISANLVKGRTLTSYFTIQDDVKNAGGNWVDQEVAVDGNWVTSREPKDIPAFNREVIRILTEKKEKAAA